jgi:hypothetical protein
MGKYKVLFVNDRPIGPKKISEAVSGFGESYSNTVRNMIKNTDAPGPR